MKQRFFSLLTLFSLLLSLSFVSATPVLANDNCCGIDRSCSAQHEWEAGYFAFQAGQCGGGSQPSQPAQQSQPAQSGGGSSCSGARDCNVTCANGQKLSDACPANGAYKSCGDWANEACGTRGSTVENQNSPSSPQQSESSSQPAPVESGSNICGAGGAQGCAGKPVGYIMDVGTERMRCFKSSPSASTCGRDFVDAQGNHTTGSVAATPTQSAPTTSTVCAPNSADGCEGKPYGTQVVLPGSTSVIRCEKRENNDRCLRTVVTYNSADYKNNSNESQTVTKLYKISGTPGSSSCQEATCLANDPTCYSSLQACESYRSSVDREVARGAQVTQYVLQSDNTCVQGLCGPESNKCHPTQSKCQSAAQAAIRAEQAAALAKRAEAERACTDSKGQSLRCGEQQYCINPQLPQTCDEIQGKPVNPTISNPQTIATEMKDLCKGSHKNLAECLEVNKVAESARWKIVANRSDICVQCQPGESSEICQYADKNRCQAAYGHLQAGTFRKTLSEGEICSNSSGEMLTDWCRDGLECSRGSNNIARCTRPPQQIPRLGVCDGENYSPSAGTCATGLTCYRPGGSSSSRCVTQEDIDRAGRSGYIDCTNNAGICSDYGMACITDPLMNNQKICQAFQRVADEGAQCNPVQRVGCREGLNCVRDGSSNTYTCKAESSAVTSRRQACEARGAGYQLCSRTENGELTTACIQGSSCQSWETALERNVVSTGETRWKLSMGSDGLCVPCQANEPRDICRYTAESQCGNVKVGLAGGSYSKQLTAGEVCQDSSGNRHADWCQDGLICGDSITRGTARCASPNAVVNLSCAKTVNGVQVPDNSVCHGNTCMFDGSRGGYVCKTPDTVVPVKNIRTISASDTNRVCLDSHGCVCPDDKGSSRVIGYDAFCPVPLQNIRTISASDQNRLCSDPSGCHCQDEKGASRVIGQDAFCPELCTCASGTYSKASGFSCEQMCQMEQGEESQDEVSTPWNGIRGSITNIEEFVRGAQIRNTVGVTVSNFVNQVNSGINQFVTSVQRLFGTETTQEMPELLPETPQSQSSLDFDQSERLEIQLNQRFAESRTEQGQALKTNGQRCVSGVECIGGFCVDHDANTQTLNQCASYETLLSVGQNCKNHRQCQSGKCENFVCTAPSQIEVILPGQVCQSEKCQCRGDDESQPIFDEVSAGATCLVSENGVCSLSSQCSGGRVCVPGSGGSPSLCRTLGSLIEEERSCIESGKTFCSNCWNAYNSQVSYYSQGQAANPGTPPVFCIDRGSSCSCPGIPGGV